MDLKGIHIIDGLAAALKSHRPLPAMAENPLYLMLCDEKTTGPAFGKMAHDLHEHRAVSLTENGKEVMEAQKNTRILYDATPERVTLSFVSRKITDGAHDTFARVTLERDGRKRWNMTQFFTSLDPTGYEAAEAAQYVDLSGGLRPHYDCKFAADFLFNLTKGDDLWRAMMEADHKNRLDDAFDAARKEGPISIIKTAAGRIDGQSRYASTEQHRVSKFPIHQK